METLEDFINEKTIPCPCQSGKDYVNCCAVFHLRREYPESAEELMRSRFCAFSLASQRQELKSFMENYLLQTWHSSTRPPEIELDLSMKWQDLQIIGRKEGKKRHKRGWISFKATYEVDGTAGVLEERSEFIRQVAEPCDKRRSCHDTWFYLSGEISSN